MEQIEQQFPPGTILTPAKARELVKQQQHISASAASAAVRQSGVEAIRQSLGGQTQRRQLGLKDLPKDGTSGASADDDNMVRSGEVAASGSSSGGLSSAPSMELLVGLGFRVMVLSGTDFGAEMEPLLFSK